jgi:adenine deaminase
VGLAGLELLIKMTKGLPLKFFFSLPVSSPPFPEFEGEDVVPLAVMEGYLARDEILALSEVTPWIRLISADSTLLAKFELGERWGKSIEGHTPGASFDKLNALVAAGLTSCHEALNAGEARERLRLGLAVMLRHGSIRSDLEALIGLVTEEPKVDTRGVMLTPDWKSPSDVIEHGYMDHLVRLAIELGVPPITAIQMATLNPAAYLRLDREFGGLAPGRRADILLVDDLRQPTPRIVIADGRVVVRDGELTFDLPPLPAPATEIPWLPHRTIPASLSPADFTVEATSSTGLATVPAIAIVSKTITQRQDVTLPVGHGEICLPADQDILKIGLLNRDSSGFVTAFLTGFGARVGGLAASVAHELHKPMVVGCREDDMLAALRRVKALGGGMVLVHEGHEDYLEGDGLSPGRSCLHPWLSELLGSALATVDSQWALGRQKSRDTLEVGEKLRRADILKGVTQLTALSDLKMQVTAGRMAGIAHQADLLAFGNRFTNRDTHDAEVSVKALKSIAVVDDNHLTISAWFPTGNNYVARVGGVDRCPFGVGDVHGVVTMPRPLRNAALSWPFELPRASQSPWRESPAVIVYAICHGLAIAEEHLRKTVKDVPQLKTKVGQSGDGNDSHQGQDNRVFQRSLTFFVH